MVLTDLQAETTYSVTVAAYTTKGDGARSKPKVVTTMGAGRSLNELPCKTVSHHATAAYKYAQETVSLCGF